MKECRKPNKKCLEEQSSNCVIWDGPDIECLNLCKGDSVTEVVYQMGKNLCAIMDQLNISAIDLKCYLEENPNLTDLQSLLQFIIDKLCELKNTETGLNITCDDVYNNIYSCIVTFNACNRQTMALPLYLNNGGPSFVSYVSNLICSIKDRVDVIESQITQINNQITHILNNCCESSPSINIAIVPVSCVYPQGVTAPQIITNDNLSELNNYLQYIANATCCTFRGIYGNEPSFYSTGVCPINPNGWTINGRDCDHYISYDCTTGRITRGNLLQFQTQTFTNINNAITGIVNAINTIFSVLCSIENVIEDIVVCLNEVKDEVKNCNCLCNCIEGPNLFAYPDQTSNYASPRYNILFIASIPQGCNVVPLTSPSGSIGDVNISVIGNDNAGASQINQITNNNSSITITTINNIPFSTSSIKSDYYLFFVAKINYRDVNDNTKTCSKTTSTQVADTLFKCGTVFELTGTELP